MQPCWDAYFARVLSTPSRGEFESAFHDRREFHCPLCKSLSNMLIPHYQPIESLDAFKCREIDLKTNNFESINENGAESETLHKKPKLDVKNELLDIIKWKQNNGIFFNSMSEESKEYCLNGQLQSQLEVDTELNTVNDINSIHIFSDMLCEAAITPKHDSSQTQLPEFQAHEAYSSFAYTLQCLEVATRECFQFPKVGQGIDANSYTSYIG